MPRVMDRRSRSRDGSTNSRRIDTRTAAAADAVGGGNSADGTTADDSTTVGQADRHVLRDQHRSGGGDAGPEGPLDNGSDAPASGPGSAEPLSPYRAARYIRSRVANACDGCKARKVRCDGRMPCGYCADRQRAGSCRYSPQRRRQHSSRRRQSQQQQQQSHDHHPGHSLQHPQQQQQVQRQQTSSPRRDASSLSSQTPVRTQQISQQQQRQPPTSPARRTPAPLGSVGSLGPGLGEQRGEPREPGRSFHSNEARGDDRSDITPTARSRPSPRPSSPSPPSARGITASTIPAPATTSATTTAASTAHVAAATAAAGEHSATEDEADVPREARLLCDAHGKLVFIGDCAPLSFFQSVRQLVTSRVGQSAFAPESSRYSVLENAGASSSWAGDSQQQQHHHADNATGWGGRLPEVHPSDVGPAVTAYLAMTTGLVDLFDRDRLADDLLLWAELERRRNNGNSGNNGGDDTASVVNYLVLAIGRLLDDEDTSRAYFEHARDAALRSLCGGGGGGGGGSFGGTGSSSSSSLGVGTVQAFALVTVYMLCSCQLSGAFLFFGLAVRAAYSVGVHRAEVNARFGPDARRQRDRLWKSLRVVDLYLSTSMGRPPATSDVDCTVSYRGGQPSSSSSTTAAAGAGVGGAGGERPPDLLDASVQILLITECVVLEVYSRRKISLQLTEGISRQLRDWSVRWLPLLKDVMAGRQSAGSAPQQSSSTSSTSTTSPPSMVGSPHGAAQAVGACQVLASYYYAVMLVSRPFLMYELCRRLSDCTPTPRKGPTTTTAAAAAAAGVGVAGVGGVGGGGACPVPPAASGKSKLADACIDAASLMVDSILDLIEKGLLNVRVPLLVSWLFASSLVLGVGLLGGFGRILEKYSRTAIRCLDHLAKTDGHAAQYSLIAQSLLETALEHLERQELEERLRRTESSSQLFGLLMPPPPPPLSSHASMVQDTPPPPQKHHITARGGHSSLVSSPAPSSARDVRRGGGMSPGVSTPGSLPPPYATGRMRDFVTHAASAGSGAGAGYDRDKGRPMYWDHHAAGLGGGAMGLGGGGGETGAGLLSLTESLLQAPDADMWSAGDMLGIEGDASSAFNLFPLLEAGGGIDLAHYL